MSVDVAPEIVIGLFCSITIVREMPKSATITRLSERRTFDGLMSR